MPQDRWAADTRAIARVVAEMEERAIEMIKNMEAVGSVTGATFRPLEGLVVPSDMLKVIQLMSPDMGKPTASRLRQVSSEVLSSRWWKWCVLHPDLAHEGRICKERRVFLLPCLFCVVECTGMRFFKQCFLFLS